MRPLVGVAVVDVVSVLARRAGAAGLLRRQRLGDLLERLLLRVNADGELRDGCGDQPYGADQETDRDLPLVFGADEIAEQKRPGDAADRGRARRSCWAPCCSRCR
jgi:hypothetical protein